MQVMTQVVRRSSISHITRGRIIGAHVLQGDCALVIQWWFNRVQEDSSGLTFQEWTPARHDIKFFYWVLIDLIIGFLGLIIKAFDNQTEIWS